MSQFETVVDNRLAAVRATLVEKAKEYRRNNDAYHNFNRAALMLNVTPERGLLGMASKHIVSVLDMIDDLDNNIEPTEALINEKIGDAINYLILLEGLLKQRINK